MASWLNGKISINCQDVNVINYRLLFVAMLNFPPNIVYNNLIALYFHVIQLAIYVFLVLLLWCWFIWNMAAKGLVEQLCRSLLLAKPKSDFQHLLIFSRLPRWVWSNNTKKTYMASWLNGEISINCQDVNVIHYRLLFVAMLNFPPNIQ
jgi:hypothetical protein